AVCAIFLPLCWSFGIGQDAPLMLLILAAGARAIERKKPVTGGAMLALCAIKPHLFAFVPVVLPAQNRYRALAAMALAGAARCQPLSAAAVAASLADDRHGGRGGASYGGDTSGDCFRSSGTGGIVGRATATRVNSTAAVRGIHDPSGTTSSTYSGGRPSRTPR